MDEVNNQISDLQDNEVKNNHTEQQKEKESKKKKNEDDINSFWDNFKRSNIHLLGVPEGEKREQKIENLFEKNNERKLP